VTQPAIRLEEPGDAQASIDVERAAFGSELEVDIINAVRDEAGSFALVAEDSGSVVGHVQLTRAWIGTDPVLALGPVGVVPDRQGEGLGSALIVAALQEAGQRGERAVILLGDPGFYGRFGFGPAGVHGLRNPFAGVHADGFVVEEEDFMIVLLDKAPRTFSGPVVWHPAFGEPVEAPERGS
jgi:putative acetyltransferase